MSGKVSDNLGRSSGLTKAASTGDPTAAAGDPAVDRDESVGTRYINTTSGELFVCTDATAGDNVWKGQLGTTVKVAKWYGARGFWGGGEDSGINNNIDYIAIATTGDAGDFGDLTSVREGGCAVSNGTRGVFAAGQDSGGIANEIEYITISTLGNATDFGDRTYSLYHSSQGVSNGTRGILGAGSNQKDLDYITIATTANAADFGDFAVMENNAGAVSNGTRGVWGGGDN